MKNSLLNMLVHKPWLTIAVCIIAVVIATIGSKNLYFRGDYKIFFEDTSEQRIAYEDMQSMFSKNENVGILIAPTKGDVFTPNTLTLLKTLTDQSWQTPLSTRVDSITNFQHTYVEEDDLIVEDLLLELDQINDKHIKTMRSVALNEPDLAGRLISLDGTVAMVNITVRLPDGDQTKDAVIIAAYVKDMLIPFKAQYPEHEFFLTGLVTMNDAFQSSATKDVMTLFPLMFLFIFILLIIMLRSTLSAISALIIVFFSIGATMGFAGWAGFYLSLATINVPIMVMTLAIADSVHLVASMNYLRSQGKTKNEAILGSIALNTMPIIITSATTAIGFLTLNFSKVPILADLGNLTAVGVTLACVFSLTMLPALLKVMPIPAPALLEENKKGMNSLANWVITHHRKILPASILVSVFAVYLSTTNTLNDIVVEYFDNTVEFRQATNFQQAHLSGVANIDFAIYTGETSGINFPENLEVIGEFSDWLRQQPEVDHVSTISDTFKRLNQNMNMDNADFYQLPDQQNIAAQYLLLFEMSLPYGLDLNNQLDISKSATRIMVTVKNLGSNEFTQFETRAKHWFLTRAPTLTITAASAPLMFAHIGEENMKAMIEGALVALLLISILLIFALRSWRLGLISLLPNFLPAALGFAVWAMISGQINMALSVVLSMTLGIIVDDTVHFLAKYQHAIKSGETSENAIRYTFNSVGRALIITTVALAAGFSILAFSSFALNSDMGLLTSIIIVIALIVDFLFLPAFLLIVDKDKNTAMNK